MFNNNGKSMKRVKAPTYSYIIFEDKLIFFLGLQSQSIGKKMNFAKTTIKIKIEFLKVFSSFLLKKFNDKKNQNLL